MAIEITVPRLGWSMEEGTFVGWLKADGEFVRAGEMLFTIEGDKAAQDIESFDQGVIRYLPNGPKSGDTVLVGQVLGHLVAQGDSVASAPLVPTLSVPKLGKMELDRGREGEAPAEPHQEIGSAGASSSRTSRIAGSRAENQRSPVSSPRARLRAIEFGIDLKSLRGSGKGGRIRERDVVQYCDHSKMQQDQAQLQTSAGLRPHTPRRLAIAKRMTASLHETAPVTLTTTVDASNLVNLREQFRSGSGDVIPSYSDFLIALTSRVLQDYLLFNARWEDQGVFVNNEVNVAFAVDTDAGLLTPVIRNADTLGIRELSRHSKTLVERARKGSLTANEMLGATFTVTNLGAFGIDAFTPIISPPQAAILGIGRIRKEATPVGRRFVARDAITLSLTFDHRVSDGAPAARFLQAIGIAVENPAARLMD